MLQPTTEFTQQKNGATLNECESCHQEKMVIYTGSMGNLCRRCYVALAGVGS